MVPLVTSVLSEVPSTDAGGASADNSIVKGVGLKLPTPSPPTASSPTMLGGPASLPPWWVQHGVDPAGPDVDKGSWSAISFSPEQQEQFGVDSSGKIVNETRFAEGINEFGNADSRIPTNVEDVTGCCFSVTLVADRRAAEKEDVGDLDLDFTDAVKTLRKKPPPRIYDEKSRGLSKEVNVTDNRLRMVAVPKKPHLRLDDIPSDMSSASSDLGDTEVNVTDNRLRMNAVPTKPRLRLNDVPDASSDPGGDTEVNVTDNRLRMNAVPKKPHLQLNNIPSTSSDLGDNMKASVTHPPGRKACCLTTRSLAKVACGTTSSATHARGWSPKCPASAAEALAWVRRSTPAAGQHAETTLPPQGSKTAHAHSAATSADIQKGANAAPHAEGAETSLRKHAKVDSSDGDAYPAIVDAAASLAVANGKSTNGDERTRETPIAEGTIQSSDNVGPQSAQDWRTKLQYNGLISLLGLTVVVAVVFTVCWRGPSGRRAGEADQLVSEDGAHVQHFDME